MATIDTSKEVVRSDLLVTRTAAWMADWSTFVDEPDYQDPEVAVADGYSNIPLPPGALSVAALAIDALPLDDVRAGRVQRVWEGAQPVVVDTPLRSRITTGYGTVTTRFETLDGRTVATERISVVDAPLNDGAPDGPTAFGTGPIDLTRVRALSWSLGEIDPDRKWSWGQEPEVVRALGQRLIAPALVAGRTVVSGRDAPRRIIALTVRTTAAAAAMGSPLTAEVVGRDGSAVEVAVSADDRLLAAVSVRLRD